MNENSLYVLLLVGLLLLCLLADPVYSSKSAGSFGRFAISVILVISYSVLIAYRPNDVPDKLSYISIFDNIKTNVSYGFNIFGEAERVEYGFLYTVKFYKKFSDNVTLFFFFICLISSVLFLYGVNKITRIITHKRMRLPLIFAVYISYFGIYYNGIAIRQGLAMALCVVAFAYFLRRKYIRSFLAWFIAFLFHRLSFIFVVIFLVYLLLKRRNISSKAYYIFMLVCIFLGIFRFGYLINKFTVGLLQHILNILKLDSAYLQYLALRNSYFPRNLIFQAICGIILTYLLGKYAQAKKLLNIHMAGILVLTMGEGITAIGRGGDFFLLFAVIALSCNMPLNLTHNVLNDRNETYEVRSTKDSCVYIRNVKYGYFLVYVMLIGYFISGLRSASLI